MMMWKIFIAALLVLLLLPVGAMAQGKRPLVIGTAEGYVNITTGFDGAHLAVFGSKQAAGDIVIEVRGPKKNAIVRQKNSVLGAWMNTRSYRFPDVYSYYDFAVGGVGLEAMSKANQAYMLMNKIGTDPAYFDVVRPAADDVGHFQEALLRNEQALGFYPTGAKVVQFLSDDLFRAEFYFPASVPMGEYHVVARLLKNGRLVGMDQVKLEVRQVGVSSYLNHFAYQQGFAYGIICLLIAFSAGWGINRLRQGF